VDATSNYQQRKKEMELYPIKDLGHALKKAGETVASSVTRSGAALLHTASEATQSGGHFVSRTFLSAVKDAEAEFKAAGDGIQRIVDSGQEVALKSLAGKKVQEYEDIIRSLVKAWPRVVLRLGGEVDALRHAAKQKRTDAQASNAMKRIATSPELSKALEKAADRSIVSFAVEFGGNVAAVANADGALGFVTEIRNFSNVRRYGSVGLSLGASVGGSGDVALGLYTASPQHYAGPFVAVTLEGAIGIGGGIVVSYDLPDLSFGGFAVPVAFGDKVNVSIGGGYTFLLA
jgi:hypothetical protein